MLRELATGALAGTALGLPLAGLFAVVGFPAWAGTLTGFALVLGCLLPVAVLFRLCLHGLDRSLDRGMQDLDPDRRMLDVGISRWPVVVTAAFLTAWLCASSSAA